MKADFQKSKGDLAKKQNEITSLKAVVAAIEAKLG